MSAYLLHGKLTATSGNRDELVSILVQASQLMRNAKGCQLYVVGLDESETDTVFVTEIWDNKEDHDNSLKVEGVRELITQAMPLLFGQPSKGQEITILAGT